jgi:hypothetical protein
MFGPDFNWKTQVMVDRLTKEECKTKVLEIDNETVLELVEKLRDAFLGHTFKTNKDFYSMITEITEIVEPYGLRYGDEIGGFATGTKWHNADYSIYLGWNTWWNYLRLHIKEVPNSPIENQNLYIIQYPLPKR